MPVNDDYLAKTVMYQAPTNVKDETNVILFAYRYRTWEREGMFLKTVVDGWHYDCFIGNSQRGRRTDFTGTKPVNLQRQMRAVLLCATCRNEDDSLSYDLPDFRPSEISLEYLVDLGQRSHPQFVDHLIWIFRGTLGLVKMGDRTSISEAHIESVV